MPVRQNQKLFYLPDLNDMEVVALLNESIVNEVRAGMRAEVQVEGMPNRLMQGRVTKVAQLAVPDWRSDVRYFEGIVKLDGPIPGLKPGMTAQVELEMPPRENVLAVPSEAVTSDDGQDVCFVVHGEDVERRPVKLGRVTQEMTEVTAGPPAKASRSSSIPIRRRSSPTTRRSRPPSPRPRPPRRADAAAERRRRPALMPPPGRRRRDAASRTRRRSRPGRYRSERPCRSRRPDPAHGIRSTSDHPIAGRGGRNHVEASCTSSRGRLRADRARSAGRRAPFLSVSQPAASELA